MVLCLCLLGWRGGDDDVARVFDLPARQHLCCLYDGVATKQERQIPSLGQQACVLVVVVV